MNVNIQTDEVLLQRYINDGDDGSISTLIKRYQAKVFTSILIIVKDQHLAEDLFQETFIKVINVLKLGKYTHEGKFLPWVTRIARNICFDHLRNSNRLPLITTQDGSDVLNFLQFTEDSCEDIIIKKEKEKSIQNLVKQLPEEQVEVLVLRHYGNLSFKEIAEVTGVSINTALGRMRYALIALKKLIVDNNIDTQ